MATILGIISVLALVYALVASFYMQGQVPGRFGVAGAIAMVYAFAGMLMSLFCLKMNEVYKLFPILGIVFNGVSILFAMFILWIQG